MKRKTTAPASGASTDIKAERKRETEKLSDKAVLVSALAILYAILLLFLQSMGKSSLTASGAVTFMKILFWGSIAGAIAFAVWAAYKERRGMLLYSGIFLFVLWASAVILYCGYWDRGFAIVYAGLFIAFVLVHVYVRLRVMGKLSSGGAMTAFVIVAAALFALLTLCAVGIRLGWLNGLLGMISI